MRPRPTASAVCRSPPLLFFLWSCEQRYSSPISQTNEKKEHLKFPLNFLLEECVTKRSYSIELIYLPWNHFQVLLEHLLAMALIILNMTLEMGYVSLKRLFLTEFGFKGRFYRRCSNTIVI